MPPRSNASTPSAADHPLDEYGPDRRRGRSLRAQLADRFPDRSAEEIEDAVQSACQRFLAEAQDLTEQARIFPWLRTVAYRTMIREAEAGRRMVAADPSGPLLEAETSDEPDPAAELMALEEEGELRVLVEEVSAALSESRRQVFALWAGGKRRAEISEQLGISERAVKKALEEIMRSAREVLARQSGGGCAEGEGLVLRLICGLAAAGEAARARLHLQHCGRCSTFADELAAWREKVPAVLPPVAIEVAHPGLLGRTVGRVGEAVGAAKRHVLGGGAEIKQQATLATYGRAPDPTPLIGTRPSTVAAVVASCLAIGGGAATICAQPGVDPLGAAKDLLAGGSEEAVKEPVPAKAEEPVTPPPAEEPAEEPVTAPVYGTEEEPESESSAKTPTDNQPHEESASKEHEATAVEPAVSEPEEVVVEEATPPPEQSFEPASPEYPAVESSSSTSSSTSSSSSPSTSSSGSESSSSAAQPAAVPKNEATQFGGP
ncbi:MAG: sigma-70 family RNA polymerase sigma factor [Actinobacteria bacterium]|nr:sigma-70 family RNA polymerase sigma factor [Actinomycetota bacterium]